MAVAILPLDTVPSRLALETKPWSAGTLQATPPALIRLPKRVPAATSITSHWGRGGEGSRAVTFRVPQPWDFLLGQTLS